MSKRIKKLNIKHIDKSVIVNPDIVIYKKINELIDVINNQNDIHRQNSN